MCVRVVREWTKGEKEENRVIRKKGRRENK